MNIVLLTNDNYFSFTAARDFLERRKNDISLIVFSSALIGKKGPFASIWWSLENTGFRHTVFKLMVYGVSRTMKIICKFFPFVPNNYSSYLWAQRNSVNCIRAVNINAPEVANQIKSMNADLIVSVSMNQIIKKNILNMPQHKCINVHCAPLPRYQGMSPYVWALANNEDYSAVTIHYMDEGLDTGNIIVQEKISVVVNDTAFALFYRCCCKAAELLLKVVDNIEKGQVTSYPQNLEDKSYFSWPTKQCVKDLRNNGFRLARFKNFMRVIFQRRPQQP